MGERSCRRALNFVFYSEKRLVSGFWRSPRDPVASIGKTDSGAMPRPGEISLAHNGVLLLDEAAEFARHVLDVLRQPLEEGEVQVARAARTVVFPARFLLVATMNPCICGYLGESTRPCRCSPHQVARYRSRLSGPLLDRIDLSVRVPAVPFKAMTETALGEASSAVRRRVAAARGTQQERNRSPAGAPVNARLQGRALVPPLRPRPLGARDSRRGEPAVPSQRPELPPADEGGADDCRPRQRRADRRRASRRSGTVPAGGVTAGRDVRIAAVCRYQPI